MVGGRIHRVSWIQSLIIEHLIKRAARFLIVVGHWLMLTAYKPRSYRAQLVGIMAEKTALEIWPDDTPTMPHIVKLRKCGEILGAFCEADTAYLIYFDRFVRNYAKETERKSRTTI